ncbi:glycerophosphodiester phosphodiesterase family protein [Desulfobotulus sp. H1]|uniref:Glycerophosphodiester phosphodiesterase family protein n=1 Tax=Desulfobotulus pelophilus TaxID=2823377 RepID=A0ABT3NAG5_9BACT|nr:glycerophosphodiester phosphodiesterase family protein [Desulfobotulus pelophilus]
MKDFPASPLVIAHRGYRMRFPENTLPAFDAAWNAGARMVELDVQWSRDGRIMVHHDTSLERCSNGKGMVREHNAYFLRQLDAGSWFSRAFAGTVIPFLEEVVAGVPEGGWLNVEVKPEAVSEAKNMSRMLASLMAICAPLKGRIVVSSFHHGFLKQLARLPHAPFIGVLSSRWQKEEALLAFATELKAFAWHPDHRGLEKTVVRRMKEAGLRVYPYTVNDQDRAAALLAMGVDGFFSDDAEILKGRDGYDST